MIPGRCGNIIHMRQIMNFVRCSTCNGKKKIDSIGGMHKKCPDCNGVGTIEPVVVNVKEQVDRYVKAGVSYAQDITLKQRGRPKGVKNEREETAL